MAKQIITSFSIFIFTFLVLIFFYPLNPQNPNLAENSGSYITLLIIFSLVGFSLYLLFILFRKHILNEKDIKFNFTKATLFSIFLIIATDMFMDMLNLRTCKSQEFNHELKEFCKSRENYSLIKKFSTR